jgi:hypothetical protein
MSMHGRGITRSSRTWTVFSSRKRAPQSQAAYKPYIIAAMILCGRFAEPDDVLRDLTQRACARRQG